MRLASFAAVYAIQYVTIERLPRLPFSTIYDGVAQSVVTALLTTVAGACVSFRAGRPEGGCSGECGDDFDTSAAEKWDVLFAAAVACYIVFYSFAYHVLWQSRRVEDMYGWTRPWVRGPNMSNKWFTPKEGETWRLYTTEEWADVHGKKFMGEGEHVDRETW